VVDTVTFIAPKYTTATATPTVVTASIAEQTYLAVDETKGIQLELDGAAITATSVTRVDLTSADGDIPDRIDIVYNMPTPFASGSAHALKVTYTTKTAQQLVETVTFQAPVYVTLPESLGTAIGTGADAGMRWKTHQLAASRPANDIANVNRQLLGELGASIHDPSSQAANGFFDITYVNMQQDGVDAANFNASSAIDGQAVGDELIPGIPGLEGGNDNIAGEALAYVEIPAPGVYTTVVSSDDGFALYMGNATNPSFLQVGVRGPTDTVMFFNATKAGVYLFRLVYWENGGGAQVEWFTVNPNGTRALVNGTQTGALKTFKRRTVAEPGLPATTPTLGVARQGGNMVLTYTGTLQSADSVNGPYAAVAGATSPLTVTPAGGQKFYRAGQ
jgi:hypothetical protein